MGKELIVMLPFLAQGHLIPFLSLAKQIQHRTGFTVIIATTPLNTQYLRCATQSNTNIHLAELPFCSEDYGLPPNTENTENIPLNLMVNLLTASLHLEGPTRRLVSDITEKEGKPPLCLIADVFFGWSVNVAKSCGTFSVAFTTSGAYGTTAYMSVWQHLPHLRVCNDEEFHLPGFPERCRLRTSELLPVQRAADGNDSWSRYFKQQLTLSTKSYGWICNTTEEMEPLGLRVLRDYLKLPVWPVLASNKSGESYYSNKKSGVSAEKFIEWLDYHASDSVVYISFGSQNTISATQMLELAKGLEMSGKPFIWVIRPPVGNDLKGEFRPEWLPERFEERMKQTKQGFLVHNWASQLEILSHAATKAFVSHCGWNSVVESLSRGVPIIGWPLSGEQAYNSKMLSEEMGVCVELTKGVKSNMAAEEVKRVIELVVDENAVGDEMRRRAGDIMVKGRGAVEDGEAKGSSVKALDSFVSELLSQRSARRDPPMTLAGEIPITKY